jgi:hypothetical protein
MCIDLESEKAAKVHKGCRAYYISAFHFAPIATSEASSGMWPCSMANVNTCSEGTCHFHPHGGRGLGGGSIHFRNVGDHLSYYTASRLRRQ